MNVRIFWVRAMKCMSAQTRPRFIRRIFWWDGVWTHVNSKGKIPSTDKVPRGGSNPWRCGQRAQALPTELFRPHTHTHINTRAHQVFLGFQSFCCVRFGPDVAWISLTWRGLVWFGRLVNHIVCYWHYNKNSWYPLGEKFIGFLKVIGLSFRFCFLITVSHLSFVVSFRCMWNFLKLVVRGFLRVLRFPPLLHRLMV